VAVSSGTVAVSHTAATAIIPAANPNANPSGFNPGNLSAVVTNLDGAITVYLGDATVTSAGYQLLKGASVTLSLGPGDAVYGLAASGSPNVAYIVSG
jgi:hypothetical protein